MTACCFHGRRWTLCRTDWRSLRGAVTVATGSVLRASEAPRPPALRLTPALSEHRTGSSGVQAPHAAPPRPSAQPSLRLLSGAGRPLHSPERPCTEPPSQRVFFLGSPPPPPEHCFLPPGGRGWQVSGASCRPQ